MTRKRGAPRAPLPPGRRGGALASSFTLRRGRIDPDPERDKEGEGGVGENEGIDDADNASEKDAVRFMVSFSSEKETKEPWPPPLLRMMLDLDPYQFVQTTKHKDDTEK